MGYIRVCKGVNDKGILVDENTTLQNNIIKDYGSDWYSSIFTYSEAQRQQFIKSGSIAGITDLTTNKLVWDFDSKENIEFARTDAIAVCSRLTAHGVEPDNIRICFSGSKGFSVEVKTNKKLTPDEYKNIVLGLAGDLPTNDTKILNPGRIFRVAMTKHQSTGLYKFPLTLDQLSSWTIDQIKKAAQKLEFEDEAQFTWSEVDLPLGIYNLRLRAEVKPAQVISSAATELDFVHKPKFLTNCKFALLHGYFTEGCRSHALISLAATFKNQGFPKEVTYRMLKGACEMSEQRNGTSPLPKGEIWNNVINQVYGPNWKGGQYSCKTDIWLKDICCSLGPYKCKEDKKEYLSVKEIGSMFKRYANDIEKNTIKTGIRDLDENLQLTVGTSNALLAAAGTGKTSWALNVLNHTSNQGLRSAFFSMDMYHILVLQKMLHKHTGATAKQLYELSRNDKQYDTVLSQVSEQYKNVDIYYKSGYTIEDMKTALIQRQEATGEKTKLVIIDYLECIKGPYSDQNANMAIIANQIKDLAMELDVCLFTLCQPQKSAGDASRPLTSMRQIKGASTLEQSFSVILGMYRPGYRTDTSEDDRYITINTLKNRLGGSFSVDCSWNGLKGEIGNLSLEEKDEAKALKERREQEYRNAQSGTSVMDSIL